MRSIKTFVSLTRKTLFSLIVRRRVSLLLAANGLLALGLWFHISANRIQVRHAFNLPAVAVSADDQHEYMLVGDNFGLRSASHLLIAQTRDPLNPETVGRFDELNGLGLDMDVSGTLAYILVTQTFFSEGETGLMVVDVTDPQTPTVAGFYQMNEPQKVVVHNEFAYVSSFELKEDGDSSFRTADKLSILDVSDPATIGLVGEIHKADIRDLAVQDRYVYLSRRSGLSIVDVANPERVEEVGFYEFDFRTSVFVKGEFAYITSGSEVEGNLLNILDVSDPSQMRLLGSYPSKGRTWDVAVDERYAYVADAEEGLTVFDISDPEQAHIVDNERKYWTFTLAQVGNHIFGTGSANAPLVVYEVLDK